MRLCLILLLLLLSGCAAHYAAVVYDPQTKIMVMAVIPEYDYQLDDPSFNPPGKVQLRIPIHIYRDAEVRCGRFCGTAALEARIPK